MRQLFLDYAHACLLGILIGLMSGSILFVVLVGTLLFLSGVAHS